MDDLCIHLVFTCISITHGKVTDTVDSHPILVAFDLFKADRSENLKVKTCLERRIHPPPPPPFLPRALLLKLRDRKVRCSDEVKAQITKFSEDKGTNNVFLVNLSLRNGGRTVRGVRGDEVIAKTRWEYVYAIR